jgi:hypothetical protein
MNGSALVGVGCGLRLARKQSSQQRPQWFHPWSRDAHHAWAWRLNCAHPDVDCDIQNGAMLQGINLLQTGQPGTYWRTESDVLVQVESKNMLPIRVLNKSCFGTGGSALQLLYCSSIGHPGLRLICTLAIATPSGRSASDDNEEVRVWEMMLTARQQASTLFVLNVKSRSVMLA